MFSLCLAVCADGYNGRIDSIFDQELASRLNDAVYLDYGGAGLYTQSHLAATQDYLSRALLLNPHSDPNTSSIIDSVREQILNYLGVNSKTHSLVFTYNTSTALNLLASIFPFRAQSELCMTVDNHNSMLGMREKLRAHGPGTRYSVVWPYSAGSTPVGPKMKCCCSPALLEQYETSTPSPVTEAGLPKSTSSTPSPPSPYEIHPCLFAFPAESNFDGRLYDLFLNDIVHAHNHPTGVGPAMQSAYIAASTCSTNPLGLHHRGPQYRWYTLIDSSKFLCTSPLDLSAHPIDFATISFYKMFGFPTGLAGLVIKNETAQELWGVGGGRAAQKMMAASSAGGQSIPRPSFSTLRSYFSGGTVNAVLADEDFHVVKSTGKLHELLEDGTIAFTSIVSVPYGIAMFKTLGPKEIHKHTTRLCETLFDSLRQLTYEETGMPVCKFYGERSSSGVATLSPYANASRASAPAPVRFGPTLNLNFLTATGDVIGYKTIEKIALTARILLRSGAFCNPGACQTSFPLSAAQIKKNLEAGYACWEDGENLSGVTNGSLRLSLGWASRWEDVKRVVVWVEEEVMSIGRQHFVTSDGEQSQRGFTFPSTSTSNGSSRPQLSLPLSQQAVPSPFDYQLPAHFGSGGAGSNGFSSPISTPKSSTFGLISPNRASLNNGTLTNGFAQAFATPLSPSRASLNGSEFAQAFPTPLSPNRASQIDGNGFAQAFSSPRSSGNMPSPSAGRPGLSRSASVQQQQHSPAPSFSRLGSMHSHSASFSSTLSPKVSSQSFALGVTQAEVDASPPYPMPDSPYVLSALTVYPIKSCAGVPVSRWFIHASSGGRATLFLDREFLLMDAYGVALSQKLVPKLQLITPTIDMDQKMLTLRTPGAAPLDISLDGDDASLGEPKVDQKSASMCSLTVCGQTALGYVYDSPAHKRITDWLTAVIGKYTVLARRSPKLQWPTVNEYGQVTASTYSNGLHAHPSAPTATTASDFSRSSFSNEDDFLLVSDSSVREVERRLHAYVAGHAVLIPHQQDASIPASRFRGNFLIDSSRTSLAPFEEDLWRSIQIGEFRLEVKRGCARCIMVNVDPKTAERQSSLYALLNTCRKAKDGRVLFGSLLSNLQHTKEAPSKEGETKWWPISIGMPCSAELA